MRYCSGMMIIITVHLLVGCNPVSNGNAYRPGLVEMEKLKKQEIKPIGDRTMFGDAWMKRRGGIIILDVKGTPYEMGYQQGKLLKQDIITGTIPKFSDPVGTNAEYRDKSEAIKTIARLYVELTFFGPLEKAQPREYLAELKGIADGSGMDFRTVFKANFLSDFLMNQTPGMVNKNINVVRPECSDVVVSGSATADRRLIFGRNTDYSGLERWTDNQTIVLYEPNGQNRYVNVATAGLIKCNSAMNDKGIVIGGNFMGFSGAEAIGTSFTILENEIMRRAGSLEEALDIVQNATRGGSFGFVLADGKTKEARIIEATQDHFGIRAMEDDALYLTNFATTPAMQALDLAAKYNVMMRNVFGRYHRIETLVEAHRGDITPATVAEFMSDHVDAVLDQERGPGYTVCGVTNVTSMVFLPADGFFWVAIGGAPACKNDYIGFDFNAEFSDTAPQVSPQVLTGSPWQTIQKKQGLEAYMSAYGIYAENRKDSRVSTYLTLAHQLDPEESVYYRILANFLLHSSDFDAALDLLNSSLSLPQSHNETALTYALMGQIYDARGSRGQAQGMYQNVIDLNQIYGNDYLTGINGILTSIARKAMVEPLPIGSIEQFTTFDLSGGVE